MQFLLFLRFEILIYLHFACVLQVRPVCRQNHEEMDQCNDSRTSSSTSYDEQMIGQIKLGCVADNGQVGATSFARGGVPGYNAKLPHVHADFVNRCGQVPRRRGDDGLAGRPHVVINKDWDSREAKDSQPGYSQQVSQEHKHSTDATSTRGCLELAMDFLNSAGGIKPFRQEDDSIQEEEGSNSVDDILHYLDDVNQHDMVAGVVGEVHVHNPLHLREGHMTTAAEQRHSGEAQNRRYQRCVRDSAEAFNAALKATHFLAEMVEGGVRSFLCSLLCLALLACCFSALLSSPLSRSLPGRRVCTRAHSAQSLPDVRRPAEERRGKKD